MNRKTLDLTLTLRLEVYGLDRDVQAPAVAHELQSFLNRTDDGRYDFYTESLRLALSTLVRSAIYQNVLGTFQHLAGEMVDTGNGGQTNRQYVEAQKATAGVSVCVDEVTARLERCVPALLRVRSRGSLTSGTERGELWLDDHCLYATPWVPRYSGRDLVETYCALNGLSIDRTEFIQE